MASNLPNTGIIGQFSNCPENIISALNENSVLFDALVQAGVEGFVVNEAALPVSPPSGTRYITADNNNIWYFTNQWIEIQSKEGFIVYAKDTDQVISYDGSVWSPVTVSATNLGAGEPVFAQINGTTGALEFKTLVAGTGLAISSDSDTITIANTSTSVDDPYNVPVANPDLEIDASSWTLVSGGGGATESLTRNTTNPIAGIADLRIETNASSGFTRVRTPVNLVPNLHTGQTIRVEFDMRPEDILVNVGDTGGSFTSIGVAILQASDGNLATAEPTIYISRQEPNDLNATGYSYDLGDIVHVDLTFDVTSTENALLFQLGIRNEEGPYDADVRIDNLKITSIIDKQVISPDPNDSKVKYSTKFVPATTSVNENDIAALRFSGNVVPGKIYQVIIFINCRVLNARASMRCNHDGTEVGIIRFTNEESANEFFISSMTSAPFLATTTSVTTDIFFTNNAGGSSEIFGGTDSRVTLLERNDMVEDTSL